MSENRIGTFGQVFPPKPTWTAADVRDQAGKTVIITGGSGGIGKETARVSESPLFLLSLRLSQASADCGEYRCCSPKVLKCISRRVQKKSLERRSRSSSRRQERCLFYFSSSTCRISFLSRPLRKSSLARSPSFIHFTTMRKLRAHSLLRKHPQSNIAQWSHVRAD